MNNYTFAEIAVGLKHSFDVVITEKMQDNFREITGDINPLHEEDEFAISKGFQAKVVFGMLTASFYSTLAGVYIPGKNSLIHSVEVKFMKPTFVNDQLTIEGVVEEKNDTFKLLPIKATIKKANGEKDTFARDYAQVLWLRNGSRFIPAFFLGSHKGTKFSNEVF